MSYIKIKRPADFYQSLQSLISHVGICNTANGMVLHLKHLEETCQILLDIESIEDFYTDSQGKILDYIDHNGRLLSSCLGITDYPISDDDEIEQRIDEVVALWNSNTKININGKWIPFQSIPYDMYGRNGYNCESLVEYILTGVMCEPQVRGWGQAFQNIVEAILNN